MQINPYSIPPLLCAISTLSTGFIVFRKNPKVRTNQIFYALCLSTTIWLLFYSINFTLSYLNVDYTLINYIYKISYCGVGFISIIFFHYTTTFLKIKWTKIWTIGNYIYGLILSLLILKTNLIIKNLKMFFWGFYPQAGILHPYFLFYFITLVLISQILLLRAISTNQEYSIKTNQIKYVLLAFFIFSFASLDFIPNYGIELYPLGYLPTSAFILIIAYAAIKHQLMEINIVIRKSIIYSILITFITVIYLMSVLISERFFQNIFGYYNVISSALTALIIALVFIPLKNRIQFLVDKLFFKGTPIEISEQNELLRQEIVQSEKHKTLSTLATGIAHEVKNPLTAIKTFAEYLPHKLDDKEFLSKFADIVSREVTRIDEMVHQLLHYGKPAPLSIKETNIYKLINNTIDILNSKFIDQKINVNKRFDADENLNLYIDPNQLRQALLNILLNAIEAMPDGGKLTVGTKVIGLKDQRNKGLKDPGDKEPHFFSPQILKSSNFLFEITIEDTGCGMPTNDLPQIFDPFFSRKDQGTGLGLSITQSLIENHKGTIEVRSTVGTGTEIKIKLPLTD